MLARRAQQSVQQNETQNVLQHEERSAVYAKCPECGHVWMVARLPMLLGNAIKRMKHAACPEGCDAAPLVAGRDDVGRHHG